MARQAHEKAASGQHVDASTEGEALLPCCGETGVAESIAAPACSSCATNGWTSSQAHLARTSQTHGLRSFPGRSGRIIASRGMSGWHVMPVTQQLVGLPSPCSGCQMPSPPSSACLPSSNLLLPKREAALLGEDFLSERMLMPSLPGCSSVSLLCCSICPLCRCVSHLSKQNVRF